MNEQRALMFNAFTTNLRLQEDDPRQSIPPFDILLKAYGVRDQKNPEKLTTSIADRTGLMFPQAALLMYIKENFPAPESFLRSWAGNIPEGHLYAYAIERPEVLMGKKTPYIFALNDAISQYTQNDFQATLTRVIDKFPFKENAIEHMIKQRRFLVELYSTRLSGSEAEILANQYTDVAEYITWMTISRKMREVAGKKAEQSDEAQLINLSAQSAAISLLQTADRTFRPTELVLFPQPSEDRFKPITLDWLKGRAFNLRLVDSKS